MSGAGLDERHDVDAYESLSDSALLRSRSGVDVDDL